MQAKTVYITQAFLSSFFTTGIFTVSMVYQVNDVGLDPLQLILVGTTLEVTAFLFEVPTGVVADLKSRRLSMIIGYVLFGGGMVLMGWIPTFWACVVANILRGIGGSFTSGAQEAWLVDETIHEHGSDEPVNQTFLRGSQAGSVGSILAIPISVAVAWQDTAMPTVAGGIGLIAIAIGLTVAMRENGFHPVPAERRETWQSMKRTVVTSVGHIRREHYLALILAISFVYGLSSDGYDRLTAPHLLQGFDLPFQEAVEPVAWFGLISLVSQVVSLGMTELVRRGINLNSGSAVATALMLSNVGIVGAIVWLAWTGSFWMALAAIWAIGGLRRTGGPLLTAWYNQQIQDPNVRATMFSVRAQAYAIGQIAGGPPAGAIGRWVSVGWGITASAAMLSLVIP